MEERKYLIQSIEISHGGDGVGEWTTKEKLATTLEEAYEMRDELEYEICCQEQYLWPEELYEEARTDMQVRWRDGCYCTHILIHIRPLNLPQIDFDSFQKKEENESATEEEKVE